MYRYKQLLIDLRNFDQQTLDELREKNQDFFYNTRNQLKYKFLQEDFGEETPDLNLGGLRRNLFKFIESTESFDFYLLKYLNTKVFFVKNEGFFQQMLDLTYINSDDKIWIILKDDLLTSKNLNLLIKEDNLVVNKQTKIAAQNISVFVSLNFERIELCDFDELVQSLKRFVFHGFHITFFDE